MTSPNDVNDAPAYQFGDWRVEPGLNQLSREGKQRQLEPKTMDVLVHLIEHANRVVPTDELLEAIWPGRVLEQSTVHRRINALRNALDDDSRNPSYIQTITKRGYRAVAPVERVLSGVKDTSRPDTVSRPGSPVQSFGDAVQRGNHARLIRICVVALTGIAIGTTLVFGIARWYLEGSTDLEADLPPSSSAAISIAVLPFANTSANPDNVYFSDGVSEDLLNDLANVSGVTVIARSSSFRFREERDVREIGHILGVTHVLGGSVRRSGDRVRVTAELIETQGGAYIWSEQYDRDLTDIFEVQDEITGKILMALNVRLGLPTVKRQFANVEAYNAYLRGRYHLNRFDLFEANRWLEIAAELDPRNADVWARRAHIWGMLSFTGEFKGPAEAAEYGTRVESIDPSHPGVLAHNAIQAFLDRHYQLSLERYVEAVEMYPNDVDVLRGLAWVLAALHRRELGLTVTKRMSLLAPLSPNELIMHIGLLLLGGDLSEARAAIEKFERLGFSFPHQKCQLALAAQDVAALRVAMELDWSQGGQPPAHESLCRAMIPFLEGDVAKARQIAANIAPAPLPGFLAEIGAESVPDLPFEIRHIIALIDGNMEAALEHLHGAVRSRELRATLFAVIGRYHWRQIFPDFYASPGYQRLLTDLGRDEDATARLVVPDLPF